MKCSLQLHLQLTPQNCWKFSSFCTLLFTDSSRPRDLPLWQNLEFHDNRWQLNGISLLDRFDPVALVFRNYTFLSYSFESSMHKTKWLKKGSNCAGYLELDSRCRQGIFSSRRWASDFQQEQQGLLLPRIKFWFSKLDSVVCFCHDSVQLSGAE